MECKVLFYIIAYCSPKVLMEPKWNVKFIRTCKGINLSNVLMEPKWNVKALVQEEDSEEL